MKEVEYGRRRRLVRVGGGGGGGGGGGKASCETSTGGLERVGGYEEVGVEVQ